MHAGHFSALCSSANQSSKIQEGKASEQTLGPISRVYCTTHTSGDTLWRDNGQLIGMLVIVLARQAQKNRN